MSIAVAIELTGLEAAAGWLGEVDKRLASSPRQVLAELGRMMVEAFRGNVETGGRRLADRGIRWPARKYPRPWPVLHRTGELLESIEVLDLGPDSVTVGPVAGHARFVHGEWPFSLPAEADVDELIGRLADYYFGRSR